MIVLGIETSCDETSAAVVCRDTGGRINVRSNMVYSQIARHQPYGGVVPEIASRCHVEVLPAILRDAIRQAEIEWTDINAVAVAHGPGLASSLLVGLTGAKALALALDCPLRTVNHLKAHLYSAFLGDEAPTIAAWCPALGLLVSGGHTCLVEMHDPCTFHMLGETLDDAAGEALDKGASLLNLGYPGGPIIEKTALNGNPEFVQFPCGMRRRGGNIVEYGELDPDYLFSFSGVKTALRYYIKDHPDLFTDGTLADVAASYQAAVFAALIDRTDRALATGKYPRLICGGGVLHNKLLRRQLQALTDHHGAALRLAEPAYCTDNAAMVAAYACMADNDQAVTDLTGIDIHPGLPVTA
jgi:N6-L-threonylcarbamoyladenine synthase